MSLETGDSRRQNWVVHAGVVGTGRSITSSPEVVLLGQPSLDNELVAVEYYCR